MGNEDKARIEALRILLKAEQDARRNIEESLIAANKTITRLRKLAGAQKRSLEELLGVSEIPERT